MEFVSDTDISHHRIYGLRRTRTLPEFNYYQKDEIMRDEERERTRDMEGGEERNT
jgi:hypothetical protein